MAQSLRSVLVVDDEPSINLGLAAVMRSAGYRAISASNGQEALDLVQREHPDVILCDIMMPPPNGYEVLQRLRMDPEVANTVFLLLTARTDRASILKGLREGADDYITKPFDVDELLARIDAAMRRVEISRQLGQAEIKPIISEAERNLLVNYLQQIVSPLTVTVASLDLLLEESKEMGLAEITDLVELGRHGADRLERLYYDLLFLRNLDAGHILGGIEDVSIQFDVEQVLRRAQEFWTRKRLTWQIDINQLLGICLPRQAFAHMVYHLVDNACKYSPLGGRITFGLQEDGLRNGMLIVTDQGPGIDVTLQEKVFERYFRGMLPDGRFLEGLGVGLTLSRAFARAWGGDVTIQPSEVGCRVVATFRLDGVLDQRALAEESLS